MDNPAIHELDDVLIKGEAGVLEFETPNPDFGQNGQQVIDAGRIATLNSNGVLLSSQVPDLAITETFTVADESERLALDVQEGDVAIQEDNSTTYIFTGGDPSDDGNWSVIVFDVLPAIDGEDITPARITFKQASDTENVESDATDTFTIDVSQSNKHKITLTEDCALSISNDSDGDSFVLYVEQDSTGDHSVTWPTGVLAPGGNELSVTSDAGALDRYAFDRIDGDWVLTSAGKDLGPI